MNKQIFERERTRHGCAMWLSGWGWGIFGIGVWTSSLGVMLLGVVLFGTFLFFASWRTADSVKALEE